MEGLGREAEIVTPIAGTTTDQETMVVVGVVAEEGDSRTPPSNKNS